MFESSEIKMKKVTLEELYEISLESARSKEGEIFIFELGNLSDLFGYEKAEKLRQEFLQNKTKVKQITNLPSIQKFTDDDDFLNNLMTFRYVPSNIFTINNEILIFDDVVAIYNKDELMIIRDENFSKNQKQLFMSIWEQGQPPKLNFEYKPNHSFYNNLNYFIDDIQVIVWPDADAKNAYGKMNEEKLEDYIANIIKSDSFFDDSAYIISFIWDMDGDRMIDIWKFTENHVDDRSGPLGDVRVYREGKLCNNLGLASGNTLLVLGSEEKLRRQSSNLKSYLEGPVPKLPLEIVNGLPFFDK